MHLTLIEGEYFEIKCEPLEDYTVLCTQIHKRFYEWSFAACF